MGEYSLTEEDRRFLALALHGVAVRQKDMHERIVALAKKIDAGEFLEEMARSWIEFVTGKEPPVEMIEE